MKYTREYTCGHTGTVDIAGKSADHEWKLEREFDKHCDACRLLEFKRHARENGLPPLTGYRTNLLLWGYEIRKSFFENKEKLTKEHIAEYNIVKEDDVQMFFYVIDEILESRTNCTWWTGNKASATVKFIMSYYIEHVKTFNAQYENIKAAEKVEKEESAILSPSSPIANDCVRIQMTTQDRVYGTLSVSYRKDDAFRTVIKSSHGFSFDSATCSWVKKVYETSAPITERAAEIAHALLSAGLRVHLEDEQVRSMVENESFTPEHRYWISIDTKHEEQLHIHFPKNRELYDAARTLPRTRYSADTYTVMINVSSFSELMDFASIYGFRFTEKASNRIAAYKERLENSKVLSVSTIPEKELKRGLRDILDAPADVLPDLVDTSEEGV